MREKARGSGCLDVRATTVPRLATTRRAHWWRAASQPIPQDPRARPCSCASVFVRDCVQHAVLDTSGVTTTVQECVAVTLRLGTGGDMTVCSVYVRPCQSWDSGLLD